MTRITSLRNFLSLRDLYLEDPIHPDIYGLVEHFREFGELPEIDSSLLALDPILKEQVEWTHLMIDYYRLIPEKYLCKIGWDSYLTGLTFSAKQFRQFARVKTGKQRGVIILNASIENSSQDSSSNLSPEEVLRNFELHLEKVRQGLIAFANLESNQREVDHLEVKAAKAISSSEWVIFNLKEVKFLRGMISTYVSLSTLSRSILEFKSDTGFYELREKSSEEDKKKRIFNSFFLERLVKEDPGTADAETCIAHLISRNNMICLETSKIKFTVLESSHEWKGFKYEIDKLVGESYEKYLQKRLRSSYNKYHILQGPEHTEYDSKICVFGVMRVHPSLYPKCFRHKVNFHCYDKLVLSEFFEVCEVCGRFEDKETKFCVNSWNHLGGIY